MAGNVQADRNEQLRGQYLGQAYTRAAAVLAKRTPLSATAARSVAPDVVAAVRPALHAEHAFQLAGITPGQATRRGLVAVAALAMDLTLFGVIAVRGPRWSRPLAGVVIATHVGLYAYSRRSSARVRAAARVEVARGDVRVAS